jgi:hypothetical protein
MKHYSMEEWVDFARGLASKDVKSLMLSHLDSGCSKCAKEAALWGRVAATADRQQMEVPEGVVRQVKAMFGSAGLERKPTMAQLLFDSMRVPAPLGVRSAAQSSRQLLFAAGHHRIDVRLEPEAGSDRVRLTGQILDTRNAEIAQGRIPVSLHVGTKVSGSAETNELGEFQLEFDLPCKVELRAILPDGRQITVGLIEPAVPTLEGASYLADSKRQKALRKPKKSTRRKV